MKSQYELVRDLAADNFAKEKTDFPDEYTNDSRCFKSGADWVRDFEKKRSEKLVRAVRVLIARWALIGADKSYSYNHLNDAIKELEDAT